MQKKQYSFSSLFLSTSVLSHGNNSNHLKELYEHCLKRIEQNNQVNDKIHEMHFILYIVTETFEIWIGILGLRVLI